MVASGVFENKNFKNRKTVNVFQKNAKHNSVVFRTYLNFDLSNIPQNAIIVSAKLELTPKNVKNKKDHSLYIEQVKDSWDRTTIKWNNQPEAYSSGSLLFADSLTHDVNSIHVFEIKDHVQNLVNYPYNNNGIRLRLKNENLASKQGFGIRYHSSRADSLNYHPKLVVQYVLPMEASSVVSHCTHGNNDGAVDLTISGGSGSYSEYVIYKIEKVETEIAKQQSTVITSGTIVNNETIDTDNLAPGVYLLRVRDSLWNGSTGYNNSTHYKYYHFLIGREGEVTKGFIAHYAYVDQVQTGINLGATASTNDYSNINYKGVTGKLGIASTGTNSYGGTNAYHFASLMDFNMDFPEDLEFSKANMNMLAWSVYYQSYSSSNESKYTIVTTDWDQDIVTWNSRPNTDTSHQIILAPTANLNGTSNGYDVIDIIPFVEYWKNNPNYGFEMELTSYGHTKYSDRSHKPFNNKNYNYFEFDFTVKEKLIATYNEETESGDIFVDASNLGVLPFTYLIATDSIPTIDTLWNIIKDSTDTDSVLFRQGAYNLENFTFTNLKSNNYFIKVLDNNGKEILYKNIFLKPNLKLFDSTGIYISGDTIKVDTLINVSVRSTIYGAIPLSENSGQEIEVIDLNNEFTLGWSLVDKNIATDSDYNFSVSLKLGNIIEFSELGTVISSVSNVKIGDKIKILKEDNQILFLFNDVILKSVNIENTSLKEDDIFKIGINLKAPLSKFIVKPIKKKNPKIKKIINHPVCFQGLGELTITQTIFKGFSISSCLLKDDQGNIINSSNTFPWTVSNLPIGEYTIEVHWTNGVTSFTTQEVFTLAYPIEWSNLSNLIEIPFTLNTIKPASNNFLVIGDANSINSTKPINSFWIETDLDGGNLKGNYINFVISDGINNYLTINVRSFLNNKYVKFYSNNSIISPFTVPQYQYINGYIMIQDNLPFKIKSNGTTIQIIHNSNVLVSIPSLNIPNPENIRVFVEESRDVKVKNTLVSFCYPVPLQYVQLDRKLKGGYYLVPLDNVLHVEYFKEYVNYNGGLTYSIFDASSTDQSNVVTETITQGFQYGDNRIDFEISGLQSGYYILEVTNEKNEKFYLRFKKQ